MGLWGNRHSMTRPDPGDDWSYLDDVGDAFAFAAAPAPAVLAGDFSGFRYCLVDGQSPGPWTGIELRFGSANGDSGVALADSLQATVLGIWTDGWLLGLRLWRPTEPVLTWLGRPAQDLPDGRTTAEVDALSKWISLAGLSRGDEMEPRVTAVLQWLDDVDGEDFGILQVLGLPDPDPQLPGRSVVLARGWAPQAPLAAAAAGTPVLWSRSDDWCLLTTTDAEWHGLDVAVTEFAGKNDITFEFRLDSRELMLTISLGRKTVHSFPLTTPWVERGPDAKPLLRDDPSLLVEAGELKIEARTLEALHRLASDHLEKEEALERALKILSLPEDVAIAALEPDRYAERENVSVAHPGPIWKQALVAAAPGPIWQAMFGIAMVACLAMAIGFGRVAIRDGFGADIDGATWSAGVVSMLAVLGAAFNGSLFLTARWARGARAGHS